MGILQPEMQAIMPAQVRTSVVYLAANKR